MKLHLPHKLRTSLIACICVAAVSSSRADVELVGSTLQTTSTGDYTYAADTSVADVTVTSVNFSHMAVSADNTTDAGTNITLTTSGDNWLIINQSGVYGIAPVENKDWDWDAPSVDSDLTLDGKVKMTLTESGIRLGGANSSALGAHTLTIKNGAVLDLKTVSGTGTIKLESGGMLVAGAADAAGIMGHKGKLAIEMSGASSQLILRGNVTNKHKDGATGSVTMSLSGGTVGATKNVDIAAAVTATGNISFQTNAYAEMDGTWSASGSAITLTLDGVVSQAATSTVDILGSGSLVLKQGGSLGIVNKQGILEVQANTTISSFASDSSYTAGSVIVQKGKTLTVTDTSQYLAYKETMDWADETWVNSTKEENGKSENFWKLMTVATAESEGQVVIGSTGSTAIVGANSASWGTNYSAPVISGNYLINGDLYISRGGSAGTTTITGDVSVSGTAIFSNAQTVKVSAGGKLTVGSILGLGHELDSGNYYGRALIEGEGSSLTAEGITFFNGHTQADNYVKMTGGTLTLGKSGVTMHNSQKSAQLLLEGGSLLASSADGWTADSNISVTLGGGESGLTIDAASKGSITFSGATTIAGTVTNQGSLVLSGALTVSDPSALKTTVAYSDTTNGYATTSYWLVKGESVTSEDGSTTTTPSLSFADAATTTSATVTGLTNPVTVTVANGGASYSVLGTVYHVNSGEVAYSSIGSNADGNALAGISLNGGQLNVGAAGAAANVSVPLTVTKESTIYGYARYAGNRSGISGGIVGDGADLIITTNATNVGTSSNHGDCFNVSGDINMGTSHSLIFREGVVRLGDIDDNTATDASSITAKNLVIESGATLQLSRAGGTLNTGVKLDGGLLHVQVLGANGTGTLNFNALEVSANSRMSNVWGGALNFTALTGSGNLSVTGASGNSARTDTVTITGASNYSGKLTAASGGTVVLNGGSVGSVEVSDDNSSVTLNSATGSTSGTSVTGSVTLKASSTASSASATLSGMDGKSATFAGVKIEKAALTGGTLSNAEVDIDAEIALNGVTAENCTFTLDAALRVGADTTLSNSVVEIGSAGSLLADEASPFELSSGSHSLILGTVTMNDATLTVGDTRYSVVESGQFSNIVLSNTANFKVTLNDVLLDLLNTNSAESPKHVALVFSGLTLSTTSGQLDEDIAPDYSGFLSLNSTLPTGYSVSVGTSGSGAATLYLTSTAGEGTASIPEPTTATLSLVALAALAARRRRKAA